MYLYVQKFITNIKLNRDLININVNCKKQVERKNLQLKGWKISAHTQDISKSKKP